VALDGPLRLAGLAVSVAARLALPDAPEGVVYRPLLPAQPRTVGLACLDVAKLSPLARAFWDTARERSRPPSPAAKAARTRLLAA